MARLSQWLCVYFLMSVLLMRLSSVWSALFNKGQAIKKQSLYFSSTSKELLSHKVSSSWPVQARSTHHLSIWVYVCLQLGCTMSATMIISIILRDIIYLWLICCRQRAVQTSWFVTVIIENVKRCLICICISFFIQVTAVVHEKNCLKKKMQSWEIIRTITGSAPAQQTNHLFLGRWPVFFQVLLHLPKLDFLFCFNILLTNWQTEVINVTVLEICQYS